MLPFMSQPSVHPACYVPKEQDSASLMFRGGYLQRTFALGNRTKFAVFAMLARTALDTQGCLMGAAPVSGATAGAHLGVNPSGAMQLTQSNSTGADLYDRYTTALYRETAFVPVLWVYDSANPTAADRVRIYVGLNRVDAASTATFTASYAGDFNAAVMHRIGERANGVSAKLSALMSDFLFLDGLAPDPSMFVEANIHGVPVLRTKAEIHAAVAAAGGWGVNGCHLDFADPLQPGKDVSGQGNHWSATGFDAGGADTVASTQTNVFATMNPLRSAYGYLGTGGFSNGNLTYKSGVTANDGLSPYATVPVVLGTVDVRLEVKIDRANAYASAGTKARVGLFGPAGALQLQDNGVAGHSGACTLLSGAAPTLATGDIVTFAVRPSLGVIEVYKGTALACTFSLFGDVWANGTVVGAGGADYSQHTWNFGQKAWSVTIPALAGAVGVSTAILPEPDVKDPAEALTQASATGANIVPVLEAGTALWNGQWVEIIKRVEASEDWRVRFSDDPGNSWATNNANAKTAAAPLVAGGAYIGHRLRVGARYGVWTAEVAHVTGTATTVTHSLNTARNVVIATRVSLGGGDRYVRHPDMAAGVLGKLNTNTQPVADGTLTAFGASAFQIAGAAPSGTYRVLVLAHRAGWLEIGSYKGNGSTDGAFDPMGIAPLWQMIKRLDNSGAWMQADRAHAPVNPMTRHFDLDKPNSEITASYDLDMVVGGTKYRTAGYSSNDTGGTYLRVAIGRPVGGVCVAPANAR